MKVNRFQGRQMDKWASELTGTQQQTGIYMQPAGTRGNTREHTQIKRQGAGDKGWFNSD